METTPSGTSIDSSGTPSSASGHDGGEDRGGRRHCRDGRPHRCGGRILLVLFIALLAGLAGGFIGKSFAHGHPFMGLSEDPSKRDAQVERAVKRIASRIDATPDQQQKLTAIARDAVKDIAPIRAKLRDAGKEALALTSAATIDRAGIERLRAGQIALADSVSRRMVQAFADAADVLTPDQRRKAADRLGETMSRGDRSGGYFRG